MKLYKKVAGLSLGFLLASYLLAGLADPLSVAPRMVAWYGAMSIATATASIMAALGSVVAFIEGLD